MKLIDKNRWSRRAVLSKLAVGTALAPFVPLLNGFAEAQQPAQVKRYVQWFYGLGTRPEYYFPKGSEADFQLGEVLAPLEKLRGDIVVFEGIDQSGGGGGEPHDMGGCFTASYIENNLVGYGPAHDDPGVVGQGTSVDQYLAKRLEGMTPYSILQLDVCNTNGRNSRIDYKGIPGEGNPYAAFDRLFAGFAPSPMAGPDPALERIRLEKRSVLDLVMGELKTLESTVIASTDRAQLQRHLDGLRSLEMRLQTPSVAAGAGCAPPVVDSSNRIDSLSYENLLVLGKLQMDIAIAALACDMTRVANIQWMRGGTDESLPMLDIDNYHGLTHNPADDGGMILKIRDASKLFHEQLAYFAERLKSIPEGNGTMLDYTTILTGSDVSEPNAHSHDNHPYLLVGGSAAYRTGRFLKYSGLRANRLFVSVCNALGYSDVTRYGDTDDGELGSGPLPGLFG